MPSITVESEDLQIVFGGKTYYVVCALDVEYEWQDHGIGAYECWGQRGVDTQMGAGDITFTDAYIVEVLDEEGAELPTLIGKALAKSAKVNKTVLDAAQDLFDSGGEFHTLVTEYAEQD